MPTECGTVIRKKMTASQESEVVNLLKYAGAIIMGKTETTELAYFHPGKTTNPHDYSRTPGGSSSGSAAASSITMAPLSIGSQTGWINYKTSILLWSSWIQTIIWINF